MTTTADLLRDLDQRNLREYDRQRMCALISDYLRPAGTGLPEPTATVNPPDLAVGPTPTPTSGPQTSSRRGSAVATNPAALTGARSRRPATALEEAARPAATTGTPR